jgi:formate dehydrogenase major subunit
MDRNIVFSTEPEDYDYMDINVPCQWACPARTNIPAYIRYVFEENYGLSYEINRMANILPGVLGRICSRPCEEKCRHGEAELGSPVNICHIKRAAADFKGDDYIPPKPSSVSIGKKVAVVGSGPAGLAAAHDLSMIGISVTLIEAFNELGGMLRYGIPAFRLPRLLLDAEIDSILEMGIHVRTGIRVGSDVPIEEILAEYDAVLLATGCYKSNRLDIPGESLDDVHAGLEFMTDYCSGKPIGVGKSVLVIGAGFTAFDCARSALRMGSEDVTICLRRTQQDLTVTEDEIMETKKEGVKISALMLSRRIVGSGKVEGVEFVRTQPGNFRFDGKREVRSITGSEFILPADSVIVATGQGPEPIPSPGKRDEHGLLKVERESFKTTVPGLYVTGDYLTGPSTVIEAISQGREAAGKIARDLTGAEFQRRVVRMEDALITDRKRAWDFIPRQDMLTVRSVEKRLETKNLEVETGYSKELVKEESKRCYLCYLHYEIDINRCIYCRYCIDVAPRDCIRLVDEIKTNERGAITGFVETPTWKDVNAVVIDNSRCIRCGKCVVVCPVDCISVTKVELMEMMLQAGD